MTIYSYTGILTPIKWRYEYFLKTTFLRYSYLFTCWSQLIELDTIEFQNPGVGIEETVWQGAGYSVTVNVSCQPAKTKKQLREAHFECFCGGFSGEYEPSV